MPYRRLPNTDSARLKALKTARQKAKELPPFKLAFSQGMVHKIESFLPSFETHLSEQRNTYAFQLDKNKEYNRLMRKAKLYISHFIQVLNMAIARGDMPVSTLDFFGLDQDERKLPSLSSDEEILEWGKKLIDGEQQRRMKGLSPVMNPTIALVKVQVDKFGEAFNYQESLKRRQVQTSDNLNRKRSEADLLIQSLWNEVEETFKDLPEELKREKAGEYGVVYVFRKNELPGIDLSRLAGLRIG